MWAAQHLGYSELARVEAAPPTAELEPIREGVAAQARLSLSASAWGRECNINAEVLLRVENLGYSKLARMGAAPPTAELDPIREGATARVRCIADFRAGLMYIADCAYSLYLGVMFRHALPKQYGIFYDMSGVLFSHPLFMPCWVVMVCMLARSWMKWTWA